jgi:AcrR family transcriptional regulator
MIKKLKTIGAMLRLNQFTVDELIAEADVNRATVCSYLREFSEHLQKVGVQVTGRRGGQIRVIRVTDQGRAILKETLERAYRDLMKAQGLPISAKPSLVLGSLPLDSYLRIGERMLERFDEVPRKDQLEQEEEVFIAVCRQLESHFANLRKKLRSDSRLLPEVAVLFVDSSALIEKASQSLGLAHFQGLREVKPSLLTSHRYAVAAEPQKENLVAIEGVKKSGASVLKKPVPAD